MFLIKFFIKQGGLFITFDINDNPCLIRKDFALRIVKNIYVVPHIWLSHSQLRQHPTICDST